MQTQHRDSSWTSLNLTLSSALITSLALACADINAVDSGLNVEDKNLGLVEGLSSHCEDGEPASDDCTWSAHAHGGDFDQFILKVPERCEGVCQLSLQTNLPVATVVYRAEEWELAESQDPINDFSVSYSFNQAGSRLISVTGYDIAGRELASDSRQVQVNVQREPVIPRDSRLSVPYFYQYQNQLHPSASCQNTSIAMVLKFLGASVTPDQITGRFGKDRAQSVDGLNSVFNQLARELGVRQLRSTGGGSLAELRAALDAGSPVIVHGYFTSYGHVLVVTGYDERGYYVNDPAGRWSGYFKGGYPGAWGEPAAGHDTFYAKAAFEAAVATSDGSTQLPLWMHWLER